MSITSRILIAGVGNVACGDEGFGPEVARRLRRMRWPDGVEIADFGIRGLDLAYALTSGFDAVVLVDSLTRGSEPGTLYLLEPRAGDRVCDHDVLRYAEQLGQMPPVVRVIACEPARIGGEQDDTMVGLSPAVTRALAPATAMVAELVATLATRS